MTKIVLLILTFNIFLFSADFPQMHTFKPYNKYKQMDKEFTISCDCGEPAKLLPYNGEDIPLAHTEPCLSTGCMKIFYSNEEI